MTKRFDPQNIRNVFNRGKQKKVEEPDLDSMSSDTTYEPHYVYDDNVRQQTAPELAKHNLFFPEDPNSPEFDELIDKIKPIDLSLAIRVQQARTDMSIAADNPLMVESQKRAELGNKGRELFDRFFMTTNANGNPEVNKALLLGSAAALALGAFFLVGQPTGKSGNAVSSTSQGTTIENADGSTVTTYPDGTVTTRRPDGTSETKKPDGTITVTTPDGVATTTYADGRIVKTLKDNSTEETLPDGTVIRRDAGGNILTNLPPTELGSDLSTGSLIQQGKQTALTTEQPTIDGAQTNQVEETTPPSDTSSVPANELTSLPVTETPPPQDTSTVSSALPPSEPVVENPNTGEPYTPQASTPQASAPSGVVLSDPPPAYTTGAAPSDSPINMGSSTTAPVVSMRNPDAMGTGDANVGTRPSSSQAPVTINAARPSGPAQGGAQPSITGAASAAPSSSVSSAPASGQNGNPTTIVRGGGQSGAAGSGAGGSGQNGGGAVLAYRSATPQPTVVMRSNMTGSAATPGGQGSGSMTVYRRQTQTETANTPAQTGYAATSANMPQGTQNQPPAPTPNITSGDTGTPTTPGINAPMPSGTLGGTDASQGQGQNLPGNLGGEPSLPAGPYRNGQYLQARLETALLMPVVDQTGGQGQLTYARTTDGTLWLGTANPSATKRLEVHYTQAVLPNGKEVAVNAYAYHTDGTLGIKGQYRDIAPTLANDLIRSALTGVRNYAEAKLQATTTITLPNGTTTVNRIVPNIWESVAGSATSVFQLPANQNTFVTVVQAPVGTNFVIVNMPAQRR